MYIFITNPILLNLSILSALSTKPEKVVNWLINDMYIEVSECMFVFVHFYYLCDIKR